MGITEDFMGYAAAFEEAFVSDDWSKVGTFFTDDAVYETVGPAPLASRSEGRAAVLAQFTAYSYALVPCAAAWYARWGEERAAAGQL